MDLCGTFQHQQTILAPRTVDVLLRESPCEFALHRDKYDSGQSQKEVHCCEHLSEYCPCQGVNQYVRVCDRRIHRMKIAMINRGLS